MSNSPSPLFFNLILELTLNNSKGVKDILLVDNKNVYLRAKSFLLVGLKKPFLSY